MERDEFNRFFEPYSANVDNADSAFYWKLSDRIIFELIQEYIPAHLLGPDSVILDAGGGTGRWVVKLAQVYECSFHLYDLSEHMLARANVNLEKAGVQDRVAVTHGDLCDMEEVPDASVDHAISIYGPLSFLDQPDRAVAEIARVLKPGGRALLMAHGFYNSLASKVAAGADVGQLRVMAETATVKWADHVPKLRTFSVSDMEELFTAAGLVPLATHGVTSLIQPGPEDFDPTNVDRSEISRRLEEDPHLFSAILELELRHGGQPNVANRGINMMSIGEKA